jgi:hypothetical protein
MDTATISWYVQYNNYRNYSNKFIYNLGFSIEHSGFRRFIESEEYILGERSRHGQERQV